MKTTPRLVPDHRRNFGLEATDDGPLPMNTANHALVQLG